MAPRRKRQRLSLDGAEAVTAVADAEQPSVSTSTAPKGAGRRQLFVRGLAPDVTTQDLTDYFSESYPIKTAVVVLDKESRESKGYGFVTFADVEDAQRAKEELNGTELKGKKLRIDTAEARQREGEKDTVKASDRIKAEREQQIKEAQTPKLIVRNLPWTIKTPEDLQKLFRSYGKVNFVNLPKKPNGELRGFGFVSLRGRKNAEKAIQELNGKEIDERPIAVDWAVDKETWQGLQKTEEVDEASQAEATEDDNLDAESSAVSSDDDSQVDDSEDDEDLDDSNTDYEDVSDDDDAEGGVELEEEDDKPKREEYTVFIRNLPFTVDDERLMEHFKQFGGVRFARVVVDRETERPKGTGFVSFFAEEDMINCLKGVPRVKLQKRNLDKKDGSTITVTHSVLEDDDADPTGRYTIDGRILQITRAVDKNEATRLTAEGAATRFNRDKDKRRLYLLSEGTIASNSPLYQQLSPSEIKMREESATMRRKQIQENPSLHLSLTRLSIRNIPRSITSKDLKQLARSAIVGFAADVKAGKRQKLNKEEVIRGGQEMLVAEKMRKKKGKGIVKQAKIVFETPAGSKVAEDTGAGRSRGYGFIEYYTHRSALMGLRWLNGHAVDYKIKGETPKSKKKAKEALEDKRKRLIVEFAIENANVVSRRSDREDKAREHPKPKGGEDNAQAANRDSKAGATRGQKRKRDSSTTSKAASDAAQQKPGHKGSRKRSQVQGSSGAEEDGRAGTGGKDKDQDKLAQRTRIIAKKRQARKAKRAGKA
ncbi:RNA recognition motif-containing protein [Neocucurbitaria cava]|uniref:RNA recognition motif-containing protein n=1 Tax=Neocucurbitaria cava TaxID=798079 RepID=A0A9W8Y7E6_9PLEO|nr:RNA recognition motif-containing protein [Neocucurbitaria cava]